MPALRFARHSSAISVDLKMSFIAFSRDWE
jgi:hypothetical protein